MHCGNFVDMIIIMLMFILPCEQGNTAVYLQYAHARICSIIRKSNKDVEELKMVSFMFYSCRLSLIWWRFSTNSPGYQSWAENFLLFSSRAEPFLSTILMSACWGYILSALQRCLSSLLVNFILYKFLEVRIAMPVLSRWSVLVLVWEHTW